MQILAFSLSLGKLSVGTTTATGWGLIYSGVLRDWELILSTVHRWRDTVPLKWNNFPIPWCSHCCGLSILFIKYKTTKTFLAATKPSPQNTPWCFCPLGWFTATIVSLATICSFLLCLCGLGFLRRATVCSIQRVIWGPFCSAEVIWRGSRTGYSQLTQRQCCILPLVTRFFIQVTVCTVLKSLCRVRGRTTYRAAACCTEAEVQRQILL